MGETNDVVGPSAVTAVSQFHAARFVETSSEYTLPDSVPSTLRVIELLLNCTDSLAMRTSAAPTGTGEMTTGVLAMFA